MILLRFTNFNTQNQRKKNVRSYCMLTFIPLKFWACYIVGKEPEPHQNFRPEPDAAPQHWLLLYACFQVIEKISNINLKKITFLN
jgi:hypothetical protein